MGHHWIYRNKKIEYRYNEQGFRTDSFDSIDWKNSVVVFGCSNIQGEGLAEEDTLVKQLEKIINRPVINLGISASGIDIACWNSTILHDFYPTPKAVVQVWSSLYRYTDYYIDGRIDNYLPNHHNYYALLNWAGRSEFYIKTDRALWKDKTIYTEASFFSETAKQVNVFHLRFFDYARDSVHPGIKSNRDAAEKIAIDLKKKGL